MPCWPWWYCPFNTDHATRCNKSNKPLHLVALSREQKGTIVLSWWILLQWAGRTLFCCCIVLPFSSVSVKWPPRVWPQTWWAGLHVLPSWSISQIVNTFYFVDIYVKLTTIFFLLLLISDFQVWGILCSVQRLHTDVGTAWSMEYYCILSKKLTIWHNKPRW